MSRSLSARLSYAFGFIVVALFVSAAMVWNFKHAAERNIESGRRNTLDTAALADAQNALWALRWGVAQYIAVPDAAVRAQILAGGTKQRADWDRAVSQLQGMDIGETGSALLAGMRANFDKYIASREKWMQLMSEGKVAEAVKERADVTTPMGAATVEAISALVEVQRQRSSEDSNTAGRDLEGMKYWGTVVLAFMVFAAVTACVIAVWVVRSISGSIHQAVAVVRTVASGDLSSRIEVAGDDEICQLLAELRKMNQSLAALVAQVRAGAAGIAAATGDISAGNQDLSQRTEQQSASLKQATASMEQITTTVRQSAENARQANELALAARSAAERGGDVVAGVVQTMDAIAGSSRRMAEIINVIDSIAFQTNILALNAAVEAARAGEQGRGFAVVAGEVRNLAQRSAHAAREIKEIIQDSVQKVDAGNSLVGDAGSSMAEIVERVKRATDLLKDISQSSSQQSAGIDQISNTVNQIDHATRQNAILVERSSASAQSLAKQAECLAQAVAVFKLGSNEDAKVAVATAGIAR